MKKKKKTLSQRDKCCPRSTPQALSCCGEGTFTASRKSRKEEARGKGEEGLGQPSTEGVLLERQTTDAGPAPRVGQGAAGTWAEQQAEGHRPQRQERQRGFRGRSHKARYQRRRLGQGWLAAGHQTETVLAGKWELLEGAGGR